MEQLKELDPELIRGSGAANEASNEGIGGQKITKMKERENE